MANDFDLFGGNDSGTPDLGVGNPTEGLGSPSLLGLGIPSLTQPSGQKLALADKTTEILPENWNQYFNYIFRIVQVDSNGNLGKDPVVVPGIDVGEIVLNLPPQSLSVSVPFSIAVTAANNGVLEENNGVVFRTITIAGTTGIYPSRSTEASPPSGFAKYASALFPQTAAAIGGLLNTAGSLVSSIPFLNHKSGGKNADAVDDLQTGYYQFWKLHNFFVAYAEAKKQKKFSNLRLTFVVAKDNLTYVGTPLVFDLQKNAQDPMLYNYRMSLRCWQVTDGKGLGGEFFDAANIRNPSFIGQALDILRQTRNTVQGVGGIISGVESDVTSVLTLINQAYLVGKDAIGVGVTANDFKSFLQNNSGIIYTYNKDLMDQTLQDLNNNPQPGVAFPALNTTTIQANQATADAVRSGSSGAKISSASAITNSVLSIPTAAESIPIKALAMPPAVQEKMSQQIDAAKNISSGQVRDLSTKIQQLGDALAAHTGMLDPTYAKIYGLTPPAKSLKAPTIDDMITMADIEGAQDALLALIATQQVYKEKSPNPYPDLNAVLPTSSQLTQPNSGIPVPMQRGATLEDMSFKYYGTPNRAQDIAVFNNLRSPFIDENGFSLFIQSVAGRTFIVTDASNLAVMQSVKLQGTGVASTKRIIVDLEDLGNNQTRVTVDGQDNLDQIYTSGTNPYLTARHPGTVGSGDTILLPSTDQPDTTGDRQTPLQARLNYAERVFKVDWAVDPKTGDFIKAPSGDLKIVYGYDNAVQAIASKMNTEEGEYEDHPGYGLPALLGERNSTLSPTQIIQAIRQRVISDPRFSDALVTPTVNGSAVRVRIDTEGAKGSGRVPVDFDLKS